MNGQSLCLLTERLGGSLLKLLIFLLKIEALRPGGLLDDCRGDLFALEPHGLAPVGERLIPRDIEMPAFNTVAALLFHRPPSRQS